MIECCAKMTEALDRHVLLPRYEFPDNEYVQEMTPQLWTVNIPAGRSRRGSSGMAISFCPWCGKEIRVEDPVPEWIEDER